MFTSEQVISAAHLVRRFSYYARLLSAYPQALLIARKNGEKLVLCNAVIFENMLRSQFSASDINADSNPQSTQTAA